jgi:hypothetical protein
LLARTIGDCRRSARAAEVAVAAPGGEDMDGIRHKGPLPLGDWQISEVFVLRLDVCYLKVAGIMRWVFCRVHAYFLRMGVSGGHGPHLERRQGGRRSDMCSADVARSYNNMLPNT